MKIAIVTPYFYPQIGGLESYVYFVTKQLIKSHHEVIVITSTKKENIIEQFEGMKVYRLKTLFTLSNTPVNPFWYIDLWKIFSNEKPDVISAHSPVPFIADLSSAIAKFQSIPFVLTYHAGSFKKGQFIADMITAVYAQTVEKIMFGNSQKLIALNEFVQNKTLSSFQNKVELIYPGVTLDSYKRSRKTNFSGKILFVGKLDKTHEWKGLRYLLEAMPTVLNSYPEAALEVVGGGDYIERYKQLAEELNIKKNVTFVGSVPNTEVGNYYSRNDIFVLPSYSDAESLGLVLLEALTYGLPIVATKVGGIPYTIVDGKNGLLAEPHNSDSLSEQLIKLLTDDQLRESISIQNKARSKLYDWNIHIEKLLNIFSSLKNA